MKIKVGDLVKTCFSNEINKVMETMDIPCVRDNDIEAVFDGFKLSDGHVYRRDQIVQHWANMGV